MDRIELLTPEERWPYFEKAAGQMGVSVAMIEKDFWVVWVLGRLFSLTDLREHLIFKGGTSLSKVFRLIRRFSEDVDVSIEKSFFGFSEENAPERAASRKQRDISLKNLSQECGKYVEFTLMKTLRNEFSEQLKTKDTWDLVIDEVDSSKQTLLFEYPAAAADKGGYVRPSVKIELGARAEHWPVSHRPIQSYVKESLQEDMDEPAVEIKVLNIERTFWEKATILHQYAHIPSDKRLPTRLSRHYSDFYCLVNSSAKKQALDEPDLLGKVARHKELYFPSAWAKYSLAKQGTLKLIPPDRVLIELGRDYRDMREMFFEEPATWEAVVKGIRGFEAEFNS